MNLDYDNHLELAKKIVQTQVADQYLVIAGSAPLDFLLQRVPKDLDVWITPHTAERLSPMMLRGILHAWGVTSPKHDDCIEVHESVYGTNTLKYRVWGRYNNTEVQIEFIEHDSATVYTTPSIQDFLHRLLQSFPVNTSRCAMYQSVLDAPVIVAPDNLLRIVGNEITLTQILYHKGMNNSELLAKSVDKYLLHCRYAFEGQDHLSATMRTYSLSGSSGLGYGMLGGVDEKRQLKAKKFDNFPDKRLPSPFPRYQVSNMSEADTPRTSGVRSRPLFRTGQGSLAQELQSARVQGTGSIQTIWDDAALRTGPVEPVDPVEF